MKKIIVLNIFLCSFILSTIYSPVNKTTAEEQIIIPNVITEETVDDDIAKSLTTSSVTTGDDYEITFGYTTELMSMLPLDEDYAPRSEFSIYSILTEEELDLLYRIVEAETYGCLYENHRNVANVIFNRLDCHFCGNTLTEILTYPNQFKVYTTGFYKLVKVSDETIRAVEDAWYCDYTGGALYFNKSDTDSYASKYCKYLFTDSCGHNFYKE